MNVSYLIIKIGEIPAKIAVLSCRVVGGPEDWGGEREGARSINKEWDKFSGSERGGKSQLFAPLPLFQIFSKCNLPLQIEMDIPPDC